MSLHDPFSAVLTVNKKWPTRSGAGGNGNGARRRADAGSTGSVSAASRCHVLASAARLAKRHKTRPAAVLPAKAKWTRTAWCVSPCLLAVITLAAMPSDVDIGRCRYLSKRMGLACGQPTPGAAIARRRLAGGSGGLYVMLIGWSSMTARQIPAAASAPKRRAVVLTCAELQLPGMATELCLTTIAL
jgi:hypothetical protein